MNIAKLTIKTNDKTFIEGFKIGDSLVDVIESAGIPLNLQCGGGGFCGKCRVRLLSGVFKVNGDIINVAKPLEVLACCTQILSYYAKIKISKLSILSLNGQILTNFSIPPKRGFSNGIHLAVDIGTTTVVAILFDGKSGKILANESSYNQQMRKGDDISARITYIESSQEHLIEMQKLVVNETINKLIKKMSQSLNISTKDIHHAAVSGNTVMSYIFVGISPRSIGVYPFSIPQREYASILAKNINLDIHSESEVYIVPSASAYIGGDIVSDIFITSSKTKKQIKNKLLIDLGTNSEMVLFTENDIFATSTAAGPAFEGGGLLYGSHAMPGAIENFSISKDFDFEYKVIGNEKAKTICGSGIVDFLANGYKTGLINSIGRYNIEKLKSIKRFTTIKLGNNMVNGAILTNIEDENVIVTEYDIEQILKAKAAIYSGFVTLLAQKNLTVNDLDQVILSGGFAKYISIENGITIGMFPDIPTDKFKIIGNGSLAGAYLAVQDCAVKHEYSKLIDLPVIVNLNEDIHFESNYIDALFFPSL